MKECTTCLNVNVWSQRNNKSKKTYWVYFVSGWEDSFCFICFCVCQSSSCSVFKMNEIHVYFMQIYQVLIFLPLLGIESEAFYIPSETFTIEIYPQSQFLMLPKLYSERQLCKVLIMTPQNDSRDSGQCCFKDKLLLRTSSKYTWNMTLKLFNYKDR